MLQDNNTVTDAQSSVGDPNEYQYQFMAQNPSLQAQTQFPSPPRMPIGNEPTTPSSASGSIAGTNGATSLYNASGGKPLPVRKVVFTGYAQSGKSTLIFRKKVGEFKDDLPTTIQDTSTALVALPDSMHTIQLHIEDTCAADAFHSTRVKQYSKCHVVAITFPLDRRDLLEEMNNEWAWIMEARSHARLIPCVLIGLKSDLRPHLRSYITTKEASMVAAALGAKYVECSSKTGEGVEDVFVAIAQAAVKQKPIKGKDGGGGKLFGFGKK
ncbi:Rho GTPase [Rhizophlyctis rosea]|nr:Rho GTPase [Rhizophlyctis rosea]